MLCAGLSAIIDLNPLGNICEVVGDLLQVGHYIHDDHGGMNLVIELGHVVLKHHLVLPVYLVLQLEGARDAFGVHFGQSMDHCLELLIH